MAAISIKAPRGEVPRISARLLSDSQAQVAMNCKLTSGRLDPYKGLALIHTSAIAEAIQTIYRYRYTNNGVDVDNWMVWAVPVDVCRSPIAVDTKGRLYYTGDGEPRMTTYADAITGGGPFPTGYFTMGVAAPVTAPGLSVVGGSAPTESRAYVYTFVTKYGEESGPSAAVLATGNITGSWNLSAMDAAPPNSGTVTAAVKDTPVAGQATVTLNTVFGIAAYEEVTFAGVTGMTNLNAKFQIQSISGLTVVVNLATTQTYSAGGTWTRKTPHNTASMTKRIYRTVGTGVDYKFVAEIAVATTTYNDIVASTALGAAIPSLFTLPPPKNMHSLVALANGAFAGLADNQLVLSEIAKPHSWPIANRYPFPAKGVTLAATSNSVLILTDQYPYIAAATVPEAASVARIETYAPCLAKRGTVDIGAGCIYPSHDGLYLATAGQATNLTAKLYRHDEWKLVEPTTLVAAFMDGQYFGRYQTDAFERILVLDANEADSVTKVDDTLDAIYRNPYDGLLYAAKGNFIYQFDSDDSRRYLINWRSKEFQLGKPENFGVAQVMAQFDEIVPLDTTILDANLALLADADNVDGEIGSAEIGLYEIGGSALRPVPTDTARSVQFSLVRAGTIVFSRDVSSSRPFKLPSGFKDEIFAVEISSSIPWHSVAMAGSAAELAKTP